MTPKAKLPTDLEPLALALEESRTDQGFNIVPYHEITSVLMTVFPFNKSLADSERRGVLAKALNHARDAGPITKSSLEASIRREEARAMAAPLTSFVLASNLSFNLHSTPRPGQVAEGIRLVRFLPARFLEARSDADLGVPEEDRFVRDYVGVLAKVRARSVGHAFELTSTRLDLLRGMWNYALLRPTIWGSSSDPTQPIGRIRPSRIHTLHDSRGRLATKMHWFNPDFRREVAPTLTSAQWRRMQRQVRSFRQRLPRISYRDELERAFVHYGRALDATDMETAFLKLWSVLEQISGVGGERYDTIIARTAFLYKPDRVTKYVLEHLRYQRNEIVHLGTPQSELRPLVYQMKRYVEQMLAFHAAMGRHFTSLEEAGAFMDLSQTPATLTRRVELIERALKFRGC